MVAALPPEFSTITDDCIAQGRLYHFAPEGGRAGAMAREPKVVKVLKVLNFWGAGRSNIFTFAADDPHPQPPPTSWVPGPSETGEEAFQPAQNRELGHAKLKI
jgi:hypothetical protein